MRGSVRGAVVRAENGEPVAGATIVGSRRDFPPSDDWDLCYRIAARYRHAADAAAMPSRPDDGSIAVERLRDMLARGEDVVVLDVCLADDLARRTDKIPRALVRAPESLASWADDLPKDRPIVAYCVYGFQVSGEAVAELRRRGLDARALSGGIAAWHAVGGPTEPLSQAPGGQP